MGINNVSCLVQCSRLAEGTRAVGDDGYELVEQIEASFSHFTRVKVYLYVCLHAA